MLSLCALSARTYGVCLCLGVHTIAKFKGQLDREEFVIIYLQGLRVCLLNL